VGGHHDKVVCVTGGVLTAAAPSRRVLEEARGILGRRSECLSTDLLDLSQGLLQREKGERKREVGRNDDHSTDSELPTPSMFQTINHPPYTVSLITDYNHKGVIKFHRQQHVTLQIRQKALYQPDNTRLNINFDSIYRILYHLLHLAYAALSLLTHIFIYYSIPLLRFVCIR
jgi:hypothetical protein